MSPKHSDTHITNNPRPAFHWCWGDSLQIHTLLQACRQLPWHCSTCVSARRPLSSEGGRAVRQLPLCHGQPPPTGYQSWHHPSLPFILSSSTWRIHSKHTRPFSSTQTSHRVITKATVVCASLIDPVCSVHGPRPEPTLNTHHNQSACEFQHSQYTIHS